MNAGTTCCSRRSRLLVAEEFTAAQVAALTAWVTQHAAARARIEVGVLAFVRRLIMGLAGGVFYNDDRVDEVAARVIAQVRAGQQATAAVTSSYLDRVFTVYDVPTPRGDVVLPERLRPVDPVVQWRRPAEQYRYARSQGVDEAPAVTRAVQRAERMAGTDLSLAMREASRQKLVLVDADADVEVRGYRRIIHPELSAGGTCGLCVAAADRFYSVEDLLPIHDRCWCTVLPVITGLPDPKSVDRKAYEDAVARAGNTSAGALARERYRFDQHGELGPVLVAEGASIVPPAEQPAA